MGYSRIDRRAVPIGCASAVTAALTIGVAPGPHPVSTAVPVGSYLVQLQADTQRLMAFDTAGSPAVHGAPTGSLVDIPPGPVLESAVADARMLINAAVSAPATPGAAATAPTPSSNKPQPSSANATSSFCSSFGGSECGLALIGLLFAFPALILQNPVESLKTLFAGVQKLVPIIIESIKAFVAKIFPARPAAGSAPPAAARASTGVDAGVADAAVSVSPAETPAVQPSSAGPALQGAPIGQAEAAHHGGRWSSVALRRAADLRAAATAADSVGTEQHSNRVATSAISRQAPVLSSSTSVSTSAEEAVSSTPASPARRVTKAASTFESSPTTRR
jgi:hypothetical protein